MIEDVVNKLIKHNLKISIVENSTGGKITSKIVEVAGSSHILDEAHILYSNESKCKYLGLKEDLFINYGAVSKEVALEMAKKLKTIANSRISIACSEIVGPSGGSPKKPVGTSYIAIILDDKEYCYHNVFSGTRVEIQDSIVSFTFMKLGELLNDY